MRTTVTQMRHYFDFMENPGREILTGHVRFVGIIYRFLGARMRFCG